MVVNGKKSNLISFNNQFFIYEQEYTLDGVIIPDI